MCQPSEVCSIATMKIKYLNETGQSKFGTCVPIGSCSNTAGCQLAIVNLPSDVISQECKVLYI